jgi:hypothetical protein
MDNLDSVSEVGRKMLAELRERQRLDKRIYVSSEDAKLLTGLRETRLRDFVASGRFPSLLDGRSRRLQVAALYDFLAERIAESHPASGERVVAGRPRKMARG